LWIWSEKARSSYLAGLGRKVGVSFLPFSGQYFLIRLFLIELTGIATAKFLPEQFGPKGLLSDQLVTVGIELFHLAEDRNWPIG